MRYYFDLRDASGVVADEEGMDLPTLAAVQKEATLSLAGLARDAAFVDKTNYAIAVAVRDEKGPVLEVNFGLQFNNQKLN
jgi:hypothetical protein